MCPSDRVLPRFFQLFELLVVAAHGLVSLLQIGRVSFLYPFQRGFFGGIIRGADLVRALERHVLEHVCQAGLTQGVLHRAGIHVSEKSEYGSFRAFADHDRQAVGEFLDRDALFEGSQVLGGGQGNEK